MLCPRHFQCHNAVLVKLPKLNLASSPMLSEGAEPAVYVHVDVCNLLRLVMMCAATSWRGQKG